MKKRLLAVLLAAVMCLVLPPTAALAAEEFEMDGTVLKKYNGIGGAVTIPDGVTSIGDGAFYADIDLTSVTIPNSVTEIGRDAFLGCKRLTSVTIPDSVTSIGYQAFQKCQRLTSVTLGNNVTNIGDHTFDMCTELTSIIIPNSVTKIGWRVFFGCSSLTSVVIGNGVSSIGVGAFYGCSALEDVYYTGSEAEWNAITILAENEPLFSATIHCNSTPRDLPPLQDPLTSTGTAKPTNDKLTVDGKEAAPAAYKIDGANYFKLRDVAMLVNGTKGQFSVDYDEAEKAIKIVTGQPYVPVGGELDGVPTQSETAQPTNNPLYIDGVKVDLPVCKIGGANYFKLRELCRALGFNAGWSAERGMFIESGKPYTDAD